MATKNNAISTSVIKAELVDFGHGTYDAYTNMAIDDILLDLADRTNRFFFRTYGFTRRSVILANSDSSLNLRGRLGGADVTRRISGGKPIYVDDNVLSYSITGPMHHGDGIALNSTAINDIFGPTIMDVLGGMVKYREKLSMGKVYSIEFDGKPMVGNGQHVGMSHSFLYHGVVAIGPWDTKNINRYLRLRREDQAALSDLPNLHDLAGDGRTVQEYKKLFEERLHHKISSMFSLSAQIGQDELNEVMESAAVRATHYADRGWVFRDDISLKRDSRFCLLWPD